ncbi:hypothetical protein MTBGP_09610 [Moorella thermoacetica]
MERGLAMHSLTYEQIDEIPVVKGNKPKPVTDPERLKVLVAPAEFFGVGKATVSIYFDGQTDPELLVSEEIARDPLKLERIITWAKAELAGDREKAKQILANY